MRQVKVPVLTETTPCFCSLLPSNWTDPRVVPSALEGPSCSSEVGRQGPDLVETPKSQQATVIGQKSAQESVVSPH